MARETPDLLIPGLGERTAERAQEEAPRPMVGTRQRTRERKTGRQPFHVFIYNVDLSTYIEVELVEYTLATFTAPQYGAAVIEGISFYPQQLEALGDLTITVKVVRSAWPFLSPRYGRIGRPGRPERVYIRLEPGQTLDVDCLITQDYRALGTNDYRIRTVCELWGFYETGGVT